MKSWLIRVCISRRWDGEFWSNPYFRNRIPCSKPRTSVTTILCRVTRYRAPKQWKHIMGAVCQTAPFDIAYEISASFKDSQRRCSGMKRRMSLLDLRITSPCETNPTNTFLNSKKFRDQVEVSFLSSNVWNPTHFVELSLLCFYDLDSVSAGRNDFFTLQLGPWTF